MIIVLKYSTNKSIIIEKNGTQNTSEILLNYEKRNYSAYCSIIHVK